MNYHGPGGDRIHDLQTEATPPAASCPARSLHTTEIASKRQLQWHARGQLTTRLEFTIFSMFFHRQAILESKGGELSSSAECMIRTCKSQDTYSPADWMPTHKPTDLSLVEDQAKNFISTARPYDDWPFSSFDFTAVWLLFLALEKYMFVVVNVDDLAQASDIRI